MFGERQLVWATRFWLASLVQSIIYYTKNPSARLKIRARQRAVHYTWYSIYIHVVPVHVALHSIREWGWEISRWRMRQFHIAVSARNFCEQESKERAHISRFLRLTHRHFLGSINDFSKCSCAETKMHQRITGVHLLTAKIEEDPYLQFLIFMHCARFIQ